MHAQSGPLTIRPLKDDPGDLQALACWLSDPRVLEFYEGRDQSFSLSDVQKKYSPRLLAQDGVQACLIIHARRRVGYLQYERLAAEDVKAYNLPSDRTVYGMDLFIGEPELWGHGLGRQVVTLAADWLRQESGAQIITLDPHVDNHRAIRCYASCGFQPLRLLPDHELHEGRRVDCWLMTKTCEAT